MTRWRHSAAIIRFEAATWHLYALKRRYAWFPKELTHTEDTSSIEKGCLRTKRWAKSVDRHAGRIAVNKRDIAYAGRRFWPADHRLISRWSMMQRRDSRDTLSTTSKLYFEARPCFAPASPSFIDCVDYADFICCRCFLQPMPPPSPIQQFHSKFPTLRLFSCYRFCIT